MQQRKGISILGYGCTRFTRSGNSIDFDKAEKEFMRAYELGVNYFAVRRSTGISMKS